jgi:hypothetical protein
VGVQHRADPAGSRGLVEAIEVGQQRLPAILVELRA